MGNPFAGKFEKNQKFYFRVSKLDKDEQGRDAVYILSGKKENVEKDNFIEGYLINIEAFSEAYEGNEIPKIRFTFRNGKSDDIAILSCGRYTGITRDVLNCLVNLPAVEMIRITPFISENPTDKKTYIHGAVRNNGIKVTKKYPYDTIPKAYEKLIPELKKKVLITTERDEFFDKLITEILTKLVYSEKITYSDTELPEVQDDMLQSDDYNDVPY